MKNIQERKEGRKEGNKKIRRGGEVVLRRGGRKKGVKEEEEGGIKEERGGLAFLSSGGRCLFAILPASVSCDVAGVDPSIRTKQAFFGGGDIAATLPRRDVD